MAQPANSTTGSAMSVHPSGHESQSSAGRGRGSSLGGNQNRIYALAGRQDQESSPDIVTASIQCTFSSGKCTSDLELSGWLFRSASQGQQPHQPRTCYTCGDPRQVARFCPRFRQLVPMVPTTVALPLAQPARGGGQASRGSGQAIRGGGQPARGRLRCGGIVMVCHRYALALFDLGSTYSYASSYLASYLDMSCDSLSAPIYVSMTVGNSIVVDQAWIGYHAILDCHANTVTLAMSGFPQFEWRGTPSHSTSRVISYVKAQRMAKKGCLAYLAYIHDSSSGYYTVYCDASLIGLDAQSGAKKVVIGDDGVMRLQGGICVPNVDGLRELILEEALSSRYSISLGITRCTVKDEDQKSGGQTKILEIIE
uniref:Uncharacterized protein LOC104235578 n=1 Tax=Nicotiana sylvestris TaxID=4096 RepID=A0A1U7XDE1_NICSY|nr:PREDICTED: uncharacterized protein LOC104235578 [Nicotiana sylvestris]